MDISFSTIPANLTTSNGYGSAGFNIVRSLQRLGHRVPFSDPDVKVQLHFSQPEWYDFHPGQYKIGYTPWESSSLPDNWVEEMNECDEVWTTSPLCKQWFKEAGVEKPLHVYQHGIEDIWTPQRRHRRNKIRFLHMGEPAPRKGGQLALDAFREAFGDSDDVHLTIKANGNNTTRAKTRSGSIMGAPQDIYPNVSLVKQDLPTDQLVEFVKSFDVLVYPSYGEGFGLIPLQAMATGMPVICTAAWAPYVDNLLPELRLDSDYGASNWQEMHPGSLFHPKKTHLVQIYEDVFESFDDYSARAFRESFKVRRAYNWDTITENAFKEVVKTFG